MANCPVCLGEGRVYILGERITEGPGGALYSYMVPRRTMPCPNPDCHGGKISCCEGAEKVSG